MPKNHTPSGAKNALKKALREIIDPNLTDAERSAVWEHFDKRCAYCEKLLERDSRRAHLDHLIPAEGNYLRNRVLACDRCNGDHKREGDWEIVLRTLTAGDELAYTHRRAHILAWREKSAPREISEELLALIETEIATLNPAIDASVARVRKCVAVK